MNRLLAQSANKNSYKSSSSFNSKLKNKKFVSATINMANNSSQKERKGRKVRKILIIE